MTGILKVKAGNAVDDANVAAPAVYDDTKVAALPYSKVEEKHRMYNS